MNRLIAIEELARGGRHSVSIDVDEVLRRCVVLSAKGFIALHNHPEGGALPSREDLILTRRMIARSSALEISMLDSLIVDDQGDCNSLRQTKAVDPWYGSRPFALHGPMIARALLNLERSLASQPDSIRLLLDGPGMKLLLALYLDPTGKLVQEVSVMTGLSRSTVARALKGLVGAGLVVQRTPSAKPRHQRYNLSEEGLIITEVVMRGESMAQP